MGRIGDFPDNGLEQIEESVRLQKSAAEVEALMDDVVNAARKLVKRSRSLSTSQLYALQTEFGRRINEVQRSIHARLAGEGK